LSGSGKAASGGGGPHEDLIDQLWQVRPLQVISPEGVRPYRDGSVAPDSIARALGVGTLVAGSVARSGDELRVSVRLIDGSDGRQLNSETVERAWGDLFALRDQLSGDVARFLRERLGQEVRLRQRRTGTSSVAAWTTLRDGDELDHDARAVWGGGDSPRGRRMLERADSLYAARGGARCTVVVPIEARGALALFRTAHELPVAAVWLRRGIAHSERALALQPGAPEALSVRGRLRYFAWRHALGSNPDSLRAGAEADLTAAVTGDSSLAPAWYALSELYRYSGRFNEAEQAAREALAADAFLSEAYLVTSGLFFTSLNLERYDDAREWCAKGARQFPLSSAFVSCEFRIVGWSGQGRAAAAKRLAARRHGRPGRQRSRDGRGPPLADCGRPVALGSGRQRPRRGAPHTGCRHQSRRAGDAGLRRSLRAVAPGRARPRAAATRQVSPQSAGEPRVRGPESVVPLSARRSPLSSPSTARLLRTAPAHFRSARRFRT